MALQFLYDGYFAGKVGIGNLSPGAKLDIKGDTTTWDGMAKIYFTDVSSNSASRNWSVGNGGTDYGALSFIVSNAKNGVPADSTGTAVMSMDGVNKRVGIGTVSPAHQLQVKNGAIGVIAVGKSSNVSDNQVVGEYIFTSDDADLGVDTTVGSILSRANDTFGRYYDLEFQTFNGTLTTQMTINKDGNVGIGTDNPVSTWLSGFDPSTGNGTFKLTSEGWIVTPYLTGLAGYYPGQGARPIVWADDSGTNLQCWDNSATDGVSLRSSNGTTRLFVREDGNVGIGTDSPGALLEISGIRENQIRLTSRDITAAVDETIGGIEFYSSDSGNEGVKASISAIAADAAGSAYMTFNTGTNVERMRIDSSGNVGIGTSPNSYSNYTTLTIGNASGTGSILDIEYQTIRTLSVYAASNGGNINVIAAKPLILLTSGAERMRILATGQIGMGTTGPTEKLEVVGNIKITAAVLSNQENADVDTGTETVAEFSAAAFTAGFFDFVIKKTTNVRSGTVYACHDGTSVAFTETSTQDLGDTSDVTLSVDISGGNMRLRATTTSDNWSIKSLIRAI